MQLRVRQDLDKSGSTTSSGYLNILSELPQSNKILAGSGTGSGYLKILSELPKSDKILARSYFSSTINKGKKWLGPPIDIEVDEKQCVLSIYVYQTVILGCDSSNV